MFKSIIRLCSFILSLWLMESQALTLSEAIQPPSETEREPFLVRIYLANEDAGSHSIRLRSHFPPDEDHLLDKSNGWSIYQANEWTIPGGPNTPPSSHLPDLQLIVAPSEDIGSNPSLELEVVPTGSHSIREYFWPRKTVSQEVPFIVSNQETLTAPSEGASPLIGSAYYRGPENESPATVSLYLNPIRTVSRPTQAATPKPKLPHYHKSPKRWLQVSLMNDKQDLKAGKNWFTLSCARQHPDNIEVETGNLPAEAATPIWQTLSAILMGQSTYEAHFSDPLPGGLIGEHDCNIHPTTILHASQSQWSSLITGGIMTIMIQQVEQTNFYTKSGQYETRRQATKKTRHIQIGFKGGKITILGGDYKRFIKRILIYHASDSAPASVILVTYSQEEIAQLDMVSYFPEPELVMLNTPLSEWVAIGSGTDDVDSGSELPLWMVDWGSQMMPLEAPVYEDPIMVYSPIG